MTRNTRRRRALIVVALAGCMTATGCTSPTTRTDAKLSSFFETPAWMTKAPWSKKEEAPPKPYPNPVKIASTWTADVLVQSGRTPTRGFGGRLFFFDEKTQAVPVEGTLTVHGFEVAKDGNDAQIRPFKFTPEQFTKHFSQSDFGASYSVWIPWDAAGGEEKRISLVPTFQTTEGKIVQGTPATVILPGTRESETMDLQETQISQSYKTHREALAQSPSRPSGLVTTTIRRYTSEPDGTSNLPSPSLQDRARAIAASQRSRNGETSARYSDVALTPRTPTVMATSATMPLGNEPSSRETTPNAVPRRIEMPSTSVK